MVLRTQVPACGWPPGSPGRGASESGAGLPPPKGGSKAGKGTRENVLPRFSCPICHTDRETEGQRGHVCWAVPSSETSAGHPGPVTGSLAAVVFLRAPVAAGGTSCICLQMHLLPSPREVGSPDQPAPGPPLRPLHLNSHLELSEFNIRK